MTKVIENESWSVADQAADFLSIDRDVCRRAFHREPEEHVREVIRWVLSQRSLPGYDPERMIERWAREHSTGVYSQNRRGGSLEKVEGLAIQTIFGGDAAA